MPSRVKSFLANSKAPAVANIAAFGTCLLSTAAYAPARCLTAGVSPCERHR